MINCVRREKTPVCPTCQTVQVGKKPRDIARKGMVVCDKKTSGSWTGEQYGCTLRINHWGECNMDGTIE